MRKSAKNAPKIDQNVSTTGHQDLSAGGGYVFEAQFSAGR